MSEHYLQNSPLYRMSLDARRARLVNGRYSGLKLENPADAPKPSPTHTNRRGNVQTPRARQVQPDVTRPVETALVDRARQTTPLVARRSDVQHWGGPESNSRYYALMRYREEPHLHNRRPPLQPKNLGIERNHYVKPRANPTPTPLAPSGGKGATGGPFGGRRLNHKSLLTSILLPNDTSVVPTRAVLPKPSKQEELNL